MWVFSSIKKCTTAMRLLASGIHANIAEDYLRIAKFIAIEAKLCTSSTWQWWQCLYQPI
jgi:hypothetical protein